MTIIRGCVKKRCNRTPSNTDTSSLCHIGHVKKKHIRNLPSTSNDSNFRKVEPQPCCLNCKHLGGHSELLRCCLDVCKEDEPSLETVCDCYEKETV